MKAAFVAALAAARAAVPSILRSKKVRIRSDKGASFEYVYAPLDKVLEAVIPAYTERGIALFQSLEGDYLTTHLAFEDEELVLAPIKLSAPAGSPPQQYGGAITYAQRQSLRIALAIAPEEDNDAEGLENLSNVSETRGPTDRPVGGDVQAAIRSLRDCKTIADLSKAWKALPERLRGMAQVEQVKDDMKATLATSGLPAGVAAAISGQATDVVPGREPQPDSVDIDPPTAPGDRDE